MSIIIIDVKKLRIAERFHCYVRPTESSILSKQCLARIGVKNSLIYGKTPGGKYKTLKFELTMKRIHKYLHNFGLFNSEFIMVGKNQDVASQINYEFAGRQNRK